MSVNPVDSKAYLWGKYRAKIGHIMVIAREEAARICAICTNMCRFVCPVAKVEKTETVTPSGKALVAHLIEQKVLGYNLETSDVFYKCTGCKLCKSWCRSEIDLAEVLLEYRKEAVARGELSPIVREFARRLKANKSLLESAEEIKKRMGRFKGLLTPKAQVLYFAGCSTLSSYPDLSLATMHLLEAGKVEFTIMEEGEWCCGRPLILMGLIDLAKEFAKRNAEIINNGNFATVISPCPICTYTFKVDYPKLGYPLNVEVLHSSEFFKNLLDARRLDLSKKLPSKVTYHDPCYLGRYQEIYELPRELLIEACGVEIKEMHWTKENARCCGGGMVVDQLWPDTASQIARERVKEAGRTGAKTCITACPHCLDMLRPAGKEIGIEVLDLSQQLIKSLSFGE